MKLSTSQKFFLEYVETGVSMSGLAQQLRQKNADDPDIYSTLLEAAGIPPSLVLTQKSQAKKKAAGSVSK